VVGPSTTQLIGNLALAMAPGLSPGDEIVVTTADHHANVGAWRRLADRGVVIRTWELDRETRLLEPRELLPLLNDRTRASSPSPTSPTCSARSTTLRRSRGSSMRTGPRCVSMGSRSPPHRELDVRAWDVDYYVFSFYKVYGPHLAVLYGKHHLLDGLATINHDFIGNQLPYKLQPGNLNFELTHA
jgi:selenocysteine lyase/cysteine desulfurase